MMFKQCYSFAPHEGHGWTIGHVRYFCLGVVHQPENMIQDLKMNRSTW